MNAIYEGTLPSEKNQQLSQSTNRLFRSYTASLMEFMRFCWPSVSERNGFVIFDDVNFIDLNMMSQMVGGSRSSVETQLNRRRLIDFIPANGPANPDDLIELGDMVKAMWQSQLEAEFPRKSFTIIFTLGKTGLDIENFELTFFQNSFSQH